MRYNFDKLIDRQGTDCVKYDLLKPLFGRDEILSMWVADMDFEVPDFIREALRRRLEHPIYGYTYRPERFYEKVAGWMNRRHGWNPNPGAIRFSPGVVPALNLSILGYTRPGDKVLVQPPVYFPFFTAVENHGRKLVYNQLIEEQGEYTIDFTDLEKKFKEGVQLMFFSHPHNPVGRAWNRTELEQLASLAVRYQVPVVSDEIHSDLVLFGNRHIPLASVNSDMAALSVTCMAPSKTFNLAGMHSSAVIIENPVLKGVYDKVLEDVHVGGGNLFGMVAMEAAYTHGDEWLDQLLKYLEGNYLYLKQFIQDEIPEIRVTPLEATYLVWLGFGRLGMDDAALRQWIIDQAGLGLVEGPKFGPGGASFQRINIATPRVVLEKAMNQLSAAVRNR